MRIPFVDLKREYQELKPDIDRIVDEVIENGDYIMGRYVLDFEKKFSSYCESKFCVGVSSGTDALTILLKTLDIKPGDEIITAANTFAGAVFSIYHVNARPVLVDVDPYTYTIDPKKIEDKITSKTRALIVVHMYGRVADMRKIKKISTKYKLKLIEDAAQAHGSLYFGKKAGSFGDAAIFSFYPSKNLGAYGQAGAIVTNNANIARMARFLRDQGQTRKYIHRYIGYNARMDNLQAAILSEKLKKLDKWNNRRRSHAQLYKKLLNKSDLILPSESPDIKSNWHLFVVRVKRRDSLIKFLDSKGIECGIHYPIPIHLLPAFSDLGYKKGDFPVTEKLASEILSLPMFPHLTKSEVEYVCAKIKEFLAS